MGMEYRNRNEVARRGKRKARGVTKAGPVTIRKADGSVTVQKPMTKEEVHTFLERTEGKVNRQRRR